MADTSAGVDYSKEKTRRGYVSIDARDPHDGGSWQVLVSDEKAKHTARKGKGHVHELADTVRWTLKFPTRIYRGVRQEEPEIDETEWLCYVARPPHGWDLKRHIQVNAWPGEIFMVFVTDERIVYHWCWDKVDPRDGSKPIRFDTRFTEEVVHDDT